MFSTGGEKEITKLSVNVNQIHSFLKLPLKLEKALDFYINILTIYSKKKLDNEEGQTLILHANDLIEKLKKLKSEFVRGKIETEKHMVNPPAEDKDCGDLAQRVKKTVIEFVNATKILNQEAHLLAKGFTDVGLTILQEQSTSAPRAINLSNQKKDEADEQNDSDSEEELSPEIIKKVQKRLEEINPPLAKKFKVSWNKYKTKKEDATEFGFLNTIVNMPGYGHIPGSDYIYLTQEEINSKLMYARKIIDDAKLAGTEYITDTIIKAYGTFLQTMLANESEGQHPGDVIPLNLIKERMPVFCVYGPPGTGKTTLASLIAKAMNLGFVNVSMDTVQAASDLVGLPKSYAGGGAPSVMVQGMIDTGTELNLVFYDEIEKADKSSVQALRQQIDVDKDSYQDNYLATQIAKGKNIPLIAANNISELPSHIRSRIIPIYFPGYDDNEKYNILKNMVIKKLTGLGHRHKYIKFQTSDPNDLGKTYKTGKQDESGNDIKGDFSGFTLPPEHSVGVDLVHPDTIKYIIDNYVIEAGVREAGAMLDRIISEASARYQRNGGTANIIVNTELVRAALGEPNPNIKVTKELEKTLASQTKEFNTSKGDLSELLDRNSKNLKDPSKVSASDKKSLTELLEKFIENSEHLINSEKEMIERLQSQESSEALQVRIKAHTNSVESFTKTMETLKKSAESLIGKKSTEEIKSDKEIKDEVDTTVSPPLTTPNDESSKKFTEMEEKIKLLQESLASPMQHQPVQTISEEQRKEFESARIELANLHRELALELRSLKIQSASSGPSGSGNLDALLQSKLQHIDALQSQVSEMNALVQRALTTTRQPTIISAPDDDDSSVNSRQLQRRSQIQQRTESRTRNPVRTPIIARPIVTPQESATFGARVGKMQLGYDIIKILEKKSRKQPAVVVAVAFNKKELLKKFNEFCESVTDKIERYNDDDVVGAVQQLNDIIQSKRTDAEKEKVLVNKLKTAKLGPVLYKDPEKDTENALQRFENKTNSVAVYNGLQTKRDPENILTILKTDDEDHPEPIVTITHEKPIDGPNFVEIICANSYPEDRDIFVTINSARKLTKDGRFTVVGCDEPPNPEAAMKLFLYGLTIELKPRLQPATRKIIEEKRGDEQLFKIYKKYQDEGVGAVGDDVRKGIIDDLKDYDAEQKRRSRHRYS